MFGFDRVIENDKDLEYELVMEVLGEFLGIEVIEVLDLEIIIEVGRCK